MKNKSKIFFWISICFFFLFFSFNLFSFMFQRTNYYVNTFGDNEINKIVQYKDTKINIFNKNVDDLEEAIEQKHIDGFIIPKSFDSSKIKFDEKMVTKVTERAYYVNEQKNKSNFNEFIKIIKKYV